MRICKSTYKYRIGRFSKEADKLFELFEAFCKVHGIRGNAQCVLGELIDKYSDLNMRIEHFRYTSGVKQDKIFSDIANHTPNGAQK